MLLEFVRPKGSNAGVNGNPPKIEILAPFGVAFEWMKGMLFRPFDLTRWLTIAFAAFIAGSWGGGMNFPYRRNFGDWKYRFNRHGEFTDWTIPAWVIALIIVGVLVILVITLLWTWVMSRGRFVFTDCVVKNHAAIAEPWREYRREGNSYFLYALLVGFASLVTMAVLVLIAWVPIRRIFFDRDGTDLGVMIFVPVILMFLLWALIAVFITMVSHFMVPVMYRRRCSAGQAFVDVTKLIFANPAPFILFVLFGIALAIGVGVVGTIVACLTCCIGGLPYISTVLLLPAIVWIAAYRLLFLRQFGDQYDVWSGTAAPAAELQAPAGPIQ
jgi:hypothetical protein